MLKAREYFDCENLSGVEHSKNNIKTVHSRFKKKKLIPPKLYTSSIEEFETNKKFDVGFLTWTLCNCSEPEIVKSLSSLIKKNGILLVAESARILVPFKNQSLIILPIKKILDIYTHGIGR